VRRCCAYAVLVQNRGCSAEVERFEPILNSQACCSIVVDRRIRGKCIDRWLGYGEKPYRFQNINQVLRNVRRGTNVLQGAGKFLVFLAIMKWSFLVRIQGEKSASYLICPILPVSKILAS